MTFPPRYRLAFREDVALRLPLTLSIAEAKAFLKPPLSLNGLAISIFCMGRGPNLPPTFSYAGVRDGETFFSASLPKAAAMYAAFELRRSCNRITSTSRATTSGALFARLRQALNPDIDRAVASVRSLPPGKRLPNYERVFAAIRGPTGWSLDFTPGFAKAIRGMIVPGHNHDAATCIAALGYSWINGALRHGGFFDPPANGIWLAATYGGPLPAVSIPTAGGGRSAQALSCFHMAHLLACLAQRRLVDAPSSDAMLGLLAEGAATTPAWTDWSRRRTAPRSYTVTHTKIGLGPRQRHVLSEATLLTHRPSGTRFGLVLQNVPAKGEMLGIVSAIVERTIERFVQTRPGAPFGPPMGFPRWTPAAYGR